MRKRFALIIVLILLTHTSSALSRGDVQIIEARENIQYLGEKITTDYALLYNRPHDQLLQNKFKENILELEKNIQRITNTTKNETTLAVLDFYNYRLDHFKKFNLEKPTLVDVSELLVASEYFVEGARSIAEQHHYESSNEEKMLIHCKEMQYYIERVSKFYMIFQIGLKGKSYNTERFTAINEVNRHLNFISKYPYPDFLKEQLHQIKNIWQHNQSFFINLERTSFPNLLLSSNGLIKELLRNLEKYHKQNL